MHLKPTKTTKWLLQWDKQVKSGDAALMCGCVHYVQSCSFISNGTVVEQQLDCMRFEGIRTMPLSIICFWNVTQYIYVFI